MRASEISARPYLVVATRGFQESPNHLRAGPFWSATGVALSEPARTTGRPKIPATFGRQRPPDFGGRRVTTKEPES